MIYSGLFWSLVFHSVYSIMYMCPNSTSVALMLLWYSSAIPPPLLSPCQLFCCSLKFDCVRSDWFTHAWSSWVSFSQVSVSRPTSILALMNSSTIISSLFFTDLACNVANLVDDVLFPILFVIVMFTKFFGLQLLVMQGCSVLLTGILFILSCLIFVIVLGGSTWILLSWLTLVFSCLSCADE